MDDILINIGQALIARQKRDLTLQQSGHKEPALVLSISIIENVNELLPISSTRNS